MKKYIYVLLIVASGSIVNTASAQQKAYDMMVNGVKVIVQPSGNDIVEIQTVIKGGVQNYPANKAGIEAMAMNALNECGTLKHDKNAFKNQLDKISAEVYGVALKNYSVIKLNCIKSDLEAAWPLYAEAITMPKFDAKEFARIKQDQLSQIKADDSDPDNAIDKYADKVAFNGRDYAKDPNGTALTIQPLTAVETKNYYQSILTKSRMVIVVVADLDRADIEAKIKGLLGAVKQGTPFELKKSFFRVYKTTFSAEKRDLATNYVEGVTSGPSPGMSDYDAFSVAMRIFYDRHFLDIRTNNGLSYAPSAWFSGGATAVSKVSVSTTEPNKYIAVFDKLVERIKREGFNAADVANMKVTYLTGFYYKNETNTAQAGSIASNEVLHNNWRRSLTFADDVKKLTPTQVSDAFRKYIGNMIWVYQGNPKKVNPILFTNGTLNKADNPISH